MISHSIRQVSASIFNFSHWLVPYRSNSINACASRAVAASAAYLIREVRNYGSIVSLSSKTPILPGTAENMEPTTRKDVSLHFPQHQHFKMRSLTSLLVLGSSLLSPVLSAGNPATFWSDYPTCEDTCHQSVWGAQSCTLSNSCSCAGCLCLADSCLCETSSWLTAVAQCIGQQCGSSAVVNAASIAASACVKNGYPLVVPSASLVSIGLAAVTAATTQASSATGDSVGTAATGESPNPTY